MIDKNAVRCGGGQNHRLDLSDGVLIKNNHIALAGGIVPALERAVRNRRGSQIIEVEVRTLEELELALAHGGEAILLDNMSVEDVRRAVERCSQFDPQIQRDGHAASRSNAPAEFAWRMFAPTPRPASTSSRLACSRTPPRPWT